ASVVTGLIGLLLFLLPILGIPVSLFGLGFGVLGTALAFFVGGEALRWPLGGLAVCSLALGVNLAVYYAPSGAFLPGRSVPRLWDPVPDRPAPPPPASAGRSGLKIEGANGVPGAPPHSRPLPEPLRASTNTRES